MPASANHDTPGHIKKLDGLEGQLRGDGGDIEEGFGAAVRASVDGVRWGTEMYGVACTQQLVPKEIR